MFDISTQTQETKQLVYDMLNYDIDLYTHSLRVATITEIIVKQLKYPQAIADEIVTGALLHDIGKIKVPKSILKKPGSLSGFEMRMVRKHPTNGLALIKDMDYSDIVKDIIENHHETEVGSGYPNHSTVMTKEAKIVALVDKYDAMRAKRCYKENFSKIDTIGNIMEMRKQFTDISEIIELLMIVEMYIDYREDTPTSGYEFIPSVTTLA